MESLVLKNRHTGEVLRMYRVRKADGQVVLKIDGSLPPGATGPPLHTHFFEREEGTVKAGTLGAQVGKEKIIVPAGGSAVFEAGEVHSWWNAGNDLLELSGQAIPAVDLDRYLEGVFAVLNAGANNRPSIFYMAHLMFRHRHTQMLARPPQFVQRMVFPLVVFIGHILGKYRGSNWPGSPESCTGAPEVVATAI